MNNLLRISLLFSFLSAYLYSFGVTTSENYVLCRYYLGSILQTNRYLSGGLPQSTMSINDKNVDNHLYCSMQYIGTHSMGLYDNTARIYDALLTRFTTQDPLSEKYPDISPYASRANNPMRYVDYDGRKLTDRATKDFQKFLNYSIRYLSVKDYEVIFNEIEAITNSEQVLILSMIKALCKEISYMVKVFMI